MAKSFLSLLVRDAGRAWRLRNARTGAVLADCVTGAFESRTRKQGLLGRTSWEPGQALVIAPCSAVHTFFMKFSLDLVFVRRDGTVVKTQCAVRPWRLAAALSAYAVIELPGGVLSRSDTRRGDVLERVTTA